MQTMQRTGTTEYKVIAGSEFKVDDGEPLGTISGYLNKTSIIDLGFDRTIKGCFKQTIKDAEKRRAQEGGEQLWPLTWGHDINTIPPGSIVSAREDNAGLFIKARLNLDYDLGKNLYSAFRFGNVKGLSMGYHATDVAWSNDAALGKTIRDLKTVDIVEGAAVLFAMNKESFVTNVKSVWPGYSASSEAKENRAMSARTISVLKTAASGIEKHVGAINAHMSAMRANSLAGFPVYGSSSSSETYDIASGFAALTDELEGKMSAETHTKIATATMNIAKHAKIIRDAVHQADDFNRLAGTRVYGQASSDEPYESKEADDPILAELRELRMSLAGSTERSIESRMDELAARIGVNLALAALLASE